MAADEARVSHVLPHVVWWKKIYIYIYIYIYKTASKLRINFYLLWTFFLMLVVFVLFLLSLCFGQISPLAFFRWFTATSDRNAESCNRIPSNYCLAQLSITPRFWPSKPLAGLGRIWNYLLTMLTWNRRDSTPLSAAPRAPNSDQGWIFWSYKSLSVLPESGPYQIFVLVFNWNHFEIRFLNLRSNFYLLQTFFLMLVVFVFLLSLRFGQISPLAFFRWFTATSDRNNYGRQ